MSGIARGAAGEAYPAIAIDRRTSTEAAADDRDHAGGAP